MRSVTTFISVGLAVGISLLLVATCIKPPGGRFDFNLRMSELACVKMRVNPYDVWSEKVLLRPFYSSSLEGAPPEGCTERVNAYAPWEYVYMMPLAFLPRDCAWTLYCLLMLASVAALLWLAGRRGESDRAIVALAPFLVVSYPIWSNVSVGNFSVIVLAAAALMAWALNRDKVWLAGVCWAIAMVKPQIGLIFSIPLLMRGKWRTCFGAAGICLVASIAAAIWCRAGLVDMLLQASLASASAFCGCGTWPRMLCGASCGNGDILAGIAVGVLVCSMMTWLLRKEKDWFVLLMPAAIVSSCWTYVQAFSHAMGWFVAYVLVRELVRNPKSKFLWVLAALAAFSLSRWLLAWHGVCAFAGGRFPMDEYVFRCLDSLNSTLSLFVAFALCLWLRRHSRLS